MKGISQVQIEEFFGKNLQKYEILSPKTPKIMKKPKISGTETSKRNLTLFRPPCPPHFFQILKANFMGFRVNYVLNLHCDAYFFYWHFCVGCQKRQFFRKIMKYDPYPIFFLHMNINIGHNLYLLIFTDNTINKFAAL